MSREIKFRGRRVDNGEWIFGSLLDGDIIVAGPVDADGDYIGLGEWSSVDMETVGQITGLKDRNCKEIFEGDILKIPDLYETPENTTTKYHYEAVVFDEGCFRSGNSRIPLTDEWDYLRDESEVIGNVWDNPELLEARSAIGTTE